jgi:hypothetical protein
MPLVLPAKQGGSHKGFGSYVATVQGSVDLVLAFSLSKGTFAGDRVPHGALTVVAHPSTHVTAFR